MENEPQELEDGGKIEIDRNPDGTFKEGHLKVPGSGRPKNTMKDYLRRKFVNMPDEVKEKFLIDNKVSGTDQIKLAEGNPAQDVGLGQAENLKPLFLPSDIINKNELSISPGTEADSK